jgi:hypothetical protein
MRTFDLSGGIVRLDGAPAAVAAALDERWSAFAVAHGAPWLDVTIVERAGPFGAGAPLAASLVDEGEPVRYETPEGRIAVGRSGRAELALAPGAPAERVFTLVNLVLAALACVAPRHGALVLHGAGITLAGRGFALVGPAGSGKSTWTALAAGAAEPISDDLVGIDLTGSTVGLLALPFRRLPDALAGPGRWPLAALLLPAHGSIARLDPVDRRVAHATVVANLPHLPLAARVSGEASALIERLLDRVLVRRLTFARDPSFLELLGRLS